MTPLTSACLCVTLLFVCVVDLASSDQTTITAESGQKNVTLTCRAPQGKTIRAVKWSRADLGDKYVLLYQDELFDQTNQHPSFKNRVDLQDRQMKDGDVSLILKDVTINDAGTYNCKIFNGGTTSWESINTVSLTVSGQTGGSAGLIIGLSVFPLLDKKTITAESGQNVILTCQAPNNNILAVEWSRADLGEKYVLLYRDGQFDPKGQHPSFKNRVDLQDRQMKAGDVSLILKNVTINDNGTYECRVKTGNNRRKRANLSSDPISIITLSVVDPPGNTRGSAGVSVGVIIGLIVAVVILVVAVGFLIYGKHKQQSQDSYQSPVELELV